MAFSDEGGAEEAGSGEVIRYKGGQFNVHRKGTENKQVVKYRTASSPYRVFPRPRRGGETVGPLGMYASSFAASNDASAFNDPDGGVCPAEQAPAPISACICLQDLSMF